MPKNILNAAIGLGLSLTLSLAGAAQAAETKAQAPKTSPAKPVVSNDIGYRDCNLAHLSACRDSNQLFFGPYDSSGHSPRKTDFESALAKFLHGAPYQRVAQYKFSAYSVARESLVGPGGKAVHLAGGELFFDGFDTYYAPDRAAVIFDSAGHIVLVATLGSETDTAPPHLMRLSKRVLTIYVRGTTHKAALIAYVQDWGNRMLAKGVTYPGAIPKNVLASTEIFAAANDTAAWKSEQQ